MKPAVVLLGLVLLLDISFAAEETCAGRCGSFDAMKKCQCDSMCVYYGSCCDDFYTVCPRKTARGDTFEEVEGTETPPGPDSSPTPVPPTYNTIPPTVNAAPTQSNTAAPTFNTTQASAPAVDLDANPCSGRPFDAFLQLKNGSTYAFRGDYFFELDDHSVLPGYPKLIQDVWGISGPVSAAFTRLNCQGKTYIFKGRQYWRFDGDVLDENYPRDISVGFDGIPAEVDAAFAVPAPSHSGKEKAYFFKGDKYYQYEFKHQPSHEECVEMSKYSPSVLFTRYTDVYCDQTFEDLFAELLGGSLFGRLGPRLISRDWQGIRPPVDAAMVGSVYLSPNPTPPPPPPSRRRSGWKSRRLDKKRKSARRRSRHVLDDWMNYDDFYDMFDLFDFFAEPDMIEESTAQQVKKTPVQNVYFFMRDKYYRVSLQTKRVAAVNPPYPRSIAKYWLGCTREETPDAPGAEKK